MRTFVPKPNVWLFLIQVKSSVTFCTGVVPLKFLAKSEVDNTLRKVIALTVESPWLVNASRVKPYLKLLILLLLIVHVCPATKPYGWLQVLVGSVSGKSGAPAELSC